MRGFWHKLYAKQSLFYKIFLFVTTTFLAVYFLPKGPKFEYEFQKGKLWQYPTLYAPFEFSLKKSPEQIAREKQLAREDSPVYYSKDTAVYQSVMEKYHKKVNEYFEQVSSPVLKEKLINKGGAFLTEAYAKGVAQSSENLEGNPILLIQENEVSKQKVEDFVFIRRLKQEADTYFSAPPYASYTDNYYSLLLGVMQPNVFVNQNFTQKVLEENLGKVVYSKGIVKKNQMIIAKGEVVEGQKFEMLKSLQEEYLSELWKSGSYNSIFYGYFILVGMALFMVLFYLYRFRPEIFKNNSAITLIFLNVLLIIILTSLVVKYEIDYVYAVPICILPLVIKAFFDLKLGFFVHIITVMILGFIVPNSFRFAFMGVMVGGVTFLNIRELQKRVNLFLPVGYIILTYLLAYFCYTIISNGNLQNFSLGVVGLFVLNGFLVLFVQPLTYIYEKFFGLLSDISLLELSDTNSPILKELSERAPGTFYHSLQVASLAEAAATEIGANTMLVRVGALYHDIGKMNNPSFFTENQKTMVNPHDELTPLESAKIIIKHVIDGIEMARKNGIPDRIIDFIRTHHGNSLVYYFYKQQQQRQELYNEENFRYSGPIPFSKETVILMIADSVEAASKSLKNPTAEIIDKFVDSIVKKQLDDNQYINSDITLKEIEKIKKVMKEKLVNIYHLRIEYPE